MIINLLIGAIVIFVLAVAGIYIFDYVKNKPKDLKKANPAAWLLNEELQRVHSIFNHARKNYDSASNLQIYWTKINELQKEISKLNTETK
jgi:hypothetical protein